MDQRERLDSFPEALIAALDGRQANIWTTLPGIIEQVNDNATVVVQPAIKAQVISPDGTTKWVALPLLLDCPVVYQRGGGCTFTFPIAKGDECIVSFSARCIDAWWSSGGVQVQSEFRMHDLSDGFATVGPFSQATVIANISSVSAQLRSNDGLTYIDLNPTSQKVTIVAPGGFDVVAPLSTFSAAVMIGGLLTWVAGMVGSIGSGVASTITGVVNFIGQVSANGKRIDDTHTHNGVQSGGDNSGAVN
ncbi:MAG: Gp138 family membrane-puncturing spike protein [Janthinobacterium lividum]